MKAVDAPTAAVENTGKEIKAEGFLSLDVFLSTGRATKRLRCTLIPDIACFMQYVPFIKYLAISSLLEHVQKQCGENMQDFPTSQMSSWKDTPASSNLDLDSECAAF